MWDPVTLVLAVVGCTLLALAFVLLPFALRERRRQDRERILEEAVRQDCRVRAIRLGWWRYGSPFAWEWHPKRCRFYWVDCRDAEGEDRRACVLVGPRRQWDREETLTWRWA
jgi:hypothetical protein